MSGCQLSVRGRTLHQGGEGHSWGGAQRRPTAAAAAQLVAIARAAILHGITAASLTRSCPSQAPPALGAVTALAPVPLALLQGMSGCLGRVTGLLHSSQHARGRRKQGCEQTHATAAATAAAAPAATPAATHRAQFSGGVCADRGMRCQELHGRPVLRSGSAAPELGPPSGHRGPRSAPRAAVGCRQAGERQHGRHACCPAGLRGLPARRPPRGGLLRAAEGSPGSAQVSGRCPRAG